MENSRAEDIPRYLIIAVLYDGFVIREPNFLQDSESTEPGPTKQVKQCKLCIIFQDLRCDRDGIISGAAWYYNGTSLPRDFMIRSHTPQSRHRQIAILCFPPKPDDHTTSKFIDISHTSYLFALFFIIALIDTNRVNPHDTYTILSLEVVDS